MLSHFDVIVKLFDYLEQERGLHTADELDAAYGHADLSSHHCSEAHHTSNSADLVKLVSPPSETPLPAEANWQEHSQSSN